MKMNTNQTDESDAYTAFSRIQSLLQMENEEDKSHSLLNTPYYKDNDSANKGSSTIQSNDFMSPYNFRMSHEHQDLNQSTFSYNLSAGPKTNNNDTKTIISFLNETVSEEMLETKLHPDEANFHSILLRNMVKQKFNETEEVVVGDRPVDNISQAEIASNYSAVAHLRYKDIEKELNINEYYENSNNFISSSKSKILEREYNDLKAERDLWSLLEILTASNLLQDINENECDINLNEDLNQLNLNASIPDYVNKSYQSDSRIKKGAVLKEWLEKASVDYVKTTAVTTSEPWNATLNRIMYDKQRGDKYSGKDSDKSLTIKSIHPDAQLVDKNAFLAPLDGVDRLDQESLLKLIWQLIRSGQIVRAQETAAEHRIYWLAASLQGLATHYYRINQQQQDDQESISRVGNVKQPIWIRTCWKYSQQLANNQGNWNNQISNSSKFGSNSNSISVNRNRIDDSLVGILEMTIYASLSNNVKVLSESPLIASWHDRLWVYLKAVHESDITKIVHKYRCLKSTHSSLFPGCDMNLISVEREIMGFNKLEISHMSTGNCVHILNKVPPPNMNTTESLILRLQAAVIEGRSGIYNYIENTMKDILLTKDNKKIPGYSLILRLYCHFVIWLKFSPPGSCDLSDLISDEVFYLSIEKYVDHLIEKKQRSLVAAYSTYLNRSRRIIKYAELLQSIQTKTNQHSLLSFQKNNTQDDDVEAADILRLANTFFPSDVIEITRAVVDSSYSLSKKAVPPKEVRFASERKPDRPLTDGIIINQTPSSVRPNKTIKGRIATPRPFKMTAAGTPANKNRLLIQSPEFFDNNIEIVSEVVDSDVDRMNSLRWLFFDTSHRTEAVRQTNKLIVSFIVEGNQSKNINIKSLLTEYLPLDSVVAGFEQFKQRRSELNELIEQSLYGHHYNRSEDSTISFSEDYINTIKEALDVDESFWESQVSKLELWKSYIAAIDDIQEFNKVASEFRLSSNRSIGSQDIISQSLGRFRTKIERFAIVATSAIMRTIKCEPFSSEYNNPANGYKDIWNKSEESSIASILYNISHVKKIQSNHLLVNKTIADNTSDKLNVFNECCQIVSKSKIEEANDIQIELLSLKNHIYNNSTDSEFNAEVIKHLNNIKENLVDIQNNNISSKIVLFDLLSSYLNICIEASHVLETINQKVDACKWLDIGLQLANIVATEDYSLQLYSILNSNDLESVLFSINNIAMSLLRLDPSFSTA